MIRSRALWIAFCSRTFPATTAPLRVAANRAVVCALVLCATVPLHAADLVTLTPQTWDEFAPAGKEVDCIYGDFVLRNDKLVAVIANPVRGRNANMTVKEVGGCVIDLTVREPQSDQLSAFYPGGKTMAWRAAKPASDVRGADALTIGFHADADKDRPAAELTYTLKQGSPFILVETSYTNTGDKPLDVPLVDDMRADTTFEKTPAGTSKLFWAYDPWFGQAYGVLPAAGEVQSSSDAKASTIRYTQDGKTTASLAPGAKLTLVRRLFPGRNLLDVRALAAELNGIQQHDYNLTVRDASGQPVADAELRLGKDGVDGSGRTDAQGKLAFRLPANAAAAEVISLGRGRHNLELKPGSQTLELPTAGRVVAKITSESGGPIPCKVQFRATEGAKEPFFGPPSGEHAVHNLYYSHDGKFTQILPPGKYDVIISYGPEYDAVFLPLEIKQGVDSPLVATLKRTVNTPGWISADFHNHASPSGDNTSSQYGRVLNLLCEHIEYAPCTEHNRISTYEPHLTRLGVSHLMGTSTGIELTGSPLPLNHQNAFPLIYKPRTQDGGGPTPDVDPEVQIARLALWDNRSEKLVQQNHPDLGQLFYDKNGDGQPDGGFTASLPHMDVVEVHPLSTIFKPARTEIEGKVSNNRILNWLQSLNQGIRIPGVVCTDAHYNHHGSGFLRIYLQSPTDDPAQAKTLDVVHAAEQGHVIMTSGPYLEVSATAGEAGTKPAISGDLLTATSGKVTLNVRVQCPNWFDIDRVQVLVSGRMPEELNFTRTAHADRFGSGVVKFEQKIPVELKSDAHLVVVAAGEKLTMGPVMGPEHGKDMPIAVSNPIYVDVDGGGFKPNADTLGAPLPTAAGK